MGKIKTPKITSASPRQTWARRRNWEKRVLFGNRGIADEIEFRLNYRYKAWQVHGGELLRSQTMSDKEIQLTCEIIERLTILQNEWNQTNVQLKCQIDFDNYL